MQLSETQVLGQLPLTRKPTAAIRVGLLGCGTVGSEVARLILEGPEVVGRLELVRVAVLDPTKERAIDLPPGSLTDSALDVALDGDVDVIVEAIGGIEPARSAVLAALRSGRSVVTANKELVAKHGAELARAAAENRADLYFEAAVGGALPIVDHLRDRSHHDPVHRIVGIVNGTTNFILSRIEEGVSFGDALEEAQLRGFAEADPSADLDGTDAAAKAAILASLLSGGWIGPSWVETEGIRSVGKDVVALARGLGYSVKLVATIDFTPAGPVSSVKPTLVPHAHRLAQVDGEDNCVIVEGASGSLVFEGRGAGGLATAGSVHADIYRTCQNIAKGVRSPLPTTALAGARADAVATTEFFIAIDGCRESRTAVDAVLDEEAVSLVAAADGLGGEHAFITEPLTRSGLAALVDALTARGVWITSILPVLDGKE